MRSTILLSLLIHCLVSGQHPTQSSTPTPSPTSWASTTVDDIPNPLATNATWQQTLQNVLARYARKDSSASAKGDDSHQAQFVTGLLSGLPGVMRGLGGVDLSQDDVGRVLDSLFADPRAAGTPAWIESLTQGGSPPPSNDTQTLLLTLESQPPEVQTLALLDQMFSDVSSGLQSLNLDANSSVADIVSAVKNDSGLRSSLSTDAYHVLAALSGNPDQLHEMLQETFPVDPQSQCAEDLQTWASGLQTGEIWALQMIDAMGKLEAGVLTGQLTLVGDYLECTLVSFTNQSTDYTLEAHVCPMNFAPPEQLAPYLMYRPLTMHLCVPTSCHEKHLYALLEPTLEALGSKHRGIQCVGPRDPAGDGRFIGVTTLLAVLALLCIIGTVYGVVLDCRKAKPKEGKTKPPPVELKGVTNYGIGDGTPLKNNIDGSQSHEGADGDHVKDGGSNGDNSDGGHVKSSPSNRNARNKPDEGLTNNYMKHCEDEEDTNLTEAEGGMVKTLKSSGPEIVVHDKPSSKKPSGGSRRPQQSVGSQILLGFSVLRNGKKILNCQQNNADIACLHGIRVLSICWVVLGHSFIMLDGVTGNVISKNLLAENFTFMAIQAGVLAVDTFFLLSGCLSAFLFLRTTKKSGVTPSGLALYYIHRLWRLTPLYGVLVGIYVGIFPYLKEGPYQDAMGMDSESTCRDYWYYNLLYVNNIVNGGLTKMCFGWSWYLSNDMQFSFLAPLVLIPWTLKGSLKRLHILGFVLCACMILTHCIATGVISYTEDASFFGANNQAYMEKIYFPPWTRIGPYAIGLLLGYLLYVTPPKFTMNKVAVILGWTLATAVALTVVYVRYDNIGHVMTGLQWNASENAAFEALDKVVWAVCVAWVIFACCKGYGGFVNTLMSWSAWMPLSRLTYGVYLVHCIVLFVIGGNMKRPVYIDGWTGTTFFLATTVLSFLLSFIFSMLVEAPTLGMEKAVLGKFIRSKD